MGCANSKQKRCKNCNAPYSPVPRSYSMHVHHQPQTEGDSYHLVALTSTTLGNLNGNKVEDHDHGSFRFDNGSLMQKLKEEKEREKKKSEALENQKVKEFSVGLVEAKTWSNMIEQRITKVVPKTPTRTPPGEPETINTWELMEGLEDITPFRSPNHFRSFSFDVNNDVGVVHVNLDSTKSSLKGSPPKPMWLHMTDEEAKLNPVISDFDPEVISSFRKSLQQISPDSPFHLKPSQIDEEKEKEKEKEKQGTRNMFLSDDVFVDVKVNGKDKVVFYFTSLRGVRKTYEDCCKVKMILRGLGVKVDERDVSMHLGFKEELRELLGEEYGGGGGGGLGLPRVFIGRNYIGGAEEIQRLHEDGKLEKLLDCCEKIEEGCCEACGDIRFVPCETCFGSCKIYYQDEEEEEEKEEHDDGEYGFQRCPDCNENGLTRCPICCF